MCVVTILLLLTLKYNGQITESVIISG
jgi:hypothetical protein